MPRQSGQLFGVVAALALACGLGSAGEAPAERTTPSGSKLDPTYFVGSWIWDKQTFDQQTCLLRREIEIPRGTAVTRARLRITADNAYRVFLDGRELGQGSVWETLTEYDLSFVLTPGLHVLAVRGFNEYFEAGMVAGLRIELSNGAVVEIPSDASWRVVPKEERGWMTRKTARGAWPAATVIAPYMGKPPWIEFKPRILFLPPIQPVVTNFWQTGWFQIALLAFCAICLLLCLRLMGQLAVQSKAQQILQRERARIARDIHDEMGAGLTQLALLGEVAQNDLPPGAEMRAKLANISDKARQLVRAIDEIVWMVNSQRDSLRDFETYVCRYAEDVLRAKGIRCRLEADDEIPDAAFDLAARRNLFLAVKEALNNVVRHSGATEVSLKMHVEEGQVAVVVGDNGKGFEPATANNCRNGLSNMAQRASEAGGSCRVVSQPGAGCRVELLVPVKVAVRAKPTMAGRQPEA